MITLVKGEKHPFNRDFGIEGWRSHIEDDYFEISGFLAFPTMKEITSFESSDFKIGIYQEKEIPFIIFSSKELWFDTSINIFKMKNKTRNPWFKSKANSLTLILCDSMSNIIKGIRIIGLQSDFVSDLKGILLKQNKSYKNSNEVDIMIDYVYENLNLDQMIQKGKIYAFEASKSW